jgi:precorrin-2/cobalt-factor-2 C20-methyltransferase
MIESQHTGRNTGTLYGIGVGPGDPELIPVKAVRILQQVDCIFSACSSKNDYSMATRIAWPHLPENTPLKLLPFPMSLDQKVASRAWHEHADTIIAELDSGRDAAFLTLGDPLTYSTYGYLLRIIQQKAPHTKIQTVPGITSYQAGAAAVNTPLVEGEENLVVLSGVKGGDNLRRIAKESDNVVFLKAYKHLDDIVEALSENGLKRCFGVVRCGFPEEEVYTDLQQMKHQRPKYWSLVLAKHGRDEE